MALSSEDFRKELLRLLPDNLFAPGEASRIRRAITLIAFQPLSDPDPDSGPDDTELIEITEEEGFDGKVVRFRDPEDNFIYYAPVELFRRWTNYWRKVFDESDPPELQELLYDESAVHIFRGLRLSYVDAANADAPLYSAEDSTNIDAINELTTSRLALIWDPADGMVYPRKLHPEAFAGVEIINLGEASGVEIYAGKDVDGRHQLRKVSGGAGIDANINVNDEVEIAKKYTAIYLDHAASHNLAIAPGSIFFVKVAGNTTIANPMEFPHCHFQIILENVDGGSYTVSWGNKWVFEDGLPPIFPTTQGFCLVLDTVAKENEYLWPNVTGPFDSPGASDQPAPPISEPIISTFGSIGTGNKYTGSCQINNVVYAGGYSGSRRLGIINPATETITDKGSSPPSSGLGMYVDVVAISANEVLLWGNNSHLVEIYNVSTDTFTTIVNYGYPALRVAVVLAPNNHVYGIPNGNSTTANRGKVHKYNIANQTITILGSDVASGSDRYQGGCLCNGAVYAIPTADTQILKIDYATDTVTKFGFFPGAGIKYQGSSNFDDRFVYALPSGYSNVLKLDTFNDTVTLISAISANGCVGSSVTPNGRIFGGPQSRTGVAFFDPGSETVTVYGEIVYSLAYRSPIVTVSGFVSHPFSATNAQKITNVGTITAAMTTFPADISQLETTYSHWNRYNNKY